MMNRNITVRSHFFIHFFLNRPALSHVLLYKVIIKNFIVFLSLQVILIFIDYICFRILLT
ncbi:hypothetical protein C1645_793978 [Glomus cerebriforme]|uniref:Uncharacterized protein n=1 Tax=Glomus cerebriforme TaxID=658196 RepID=A0A397SBE0_9GLOM|nr:hypothetical protein C1645_793978 [Glomus cerebriforme]